MSCINEWFEEPPTEEGYYWFYGDPWVGENTQSVMKLHFVNVRKTSNDVMVGISSCTFINMHKWAGDNRGYFGMWMKIVVPNVEEILPKIQKLWKEKCLEIR